MTSQIDSDRRCPRCSKLMMLEIGPEESESGWTIMVHTCWSCSYVERDKDWKRPKIKVRTGPTMAERLQARRLGEGVPWREYVYPEVSDVDA